MTKNAPASHATGQVETYCPWLGFAGSPGSFDYAWNVLKWMNQAFAPEKHVMIFDSSSSWWHVEPCQSPDSKNKRVTSVSKENKL